MKLYNFEDYHKERMRDPIFKKTFDDLEPEFAIIRSILDKRLEKNISQKAFAKKLGTNQSAVSRLESGNYNPSLKFLKRVAKALGCQLKISFV